MEMQPSFNGSNAFGTGADLEGGGGGGGGGGDKGPGPRGGGGGDKGPGPPWKITKI